MKTAMQELIEIINNKRKESDISNTLLRFCQVEAEKLLKKEEEQITTAYKEGWMNPAKFRQKGSEYYYKNLFGDSNQAGI